jgi:class 3 adenylate cyclase
MPTTRTTTSPKIERRLAAILAADVAGYSGLMGADEVGTLNALKEHRRERIDPTVARHNGRIFKTTGDGLLVEFASVVDAVSCAVAIQRAMLAFNAGIHTDRQIVLRIGINVGDIIIDGDDVFGDGVNVAARLEALCEPGGVCISRYANEQVRDKLSLTWASRPSRISPGPLVCSDWPPKTSRPCPRRRCQSPNPPSCALRWHLRAGAELEPWSQVGSFLRRYWHRAERVGGCIEA